MQVNGHSGIALHEPVEQLGAEPVLLLRNRADHVKALQSLAVYRHDHVFRKILPAAVEFKDEVADGQGIACGHGTFHTVEIA